MPGAHHRLTNFDHNGEIADCHLCGPVRVWNRPVGQGKKRLTCWTLKERQYEREVARGHRGGATAARYDRAWRYNLSHDDWLSLLERQGGACGICRKSPVNKNSLAVDHDHRCCPGDKSCGSCIRGLLCGNCNLKLGWLEKYEERAVSWLNESNDAKNVAG